MAILKKIIGFIVAIFILFSLKIFSETTLQKTTHNDKKEQIEVTLLELAKELKSQLPLMLDSETRLDTVIAMGKTLNYKSTMINQPNNSLDSTLFHNQMVSVLVQNWCNNKNILDTMKAGVVYNSGYYYESGHKITSIKFNYQDCMKLL